MGWIIDEKAFADGERDVVEKGKFVLNVLWQNALGQILQ